MADWKENDKMVDLIKELGSKAIFLEWDVSKTDEGTAMVAQTIAAFGLLDYAFNNSGIEDASASTQDCSEENLDKTISINLKKKCLCIKYQIPEIRLQGKRAIINCASVVGTICFAEILASVAYKHGIARLTKTTAL